MKAAQWREYLTGNASDGAFERLYPGKAGENRQRYLTLLDTYKKVFGADPDLALFSAPGRTEIGGNHTDHQHGRVMAASVDMDTIAVAALTDEPVICVKSDGYPMCRVELDDLSAQADEVNSTASLIRGVAAGFAKMGAGIGGFNAVVTSSVLPGSGISSSAAFEVLIGNIVNSFFYDNQADAVKIAQISQYAENEYFGKPSGLMDQMASSVGNILTIDFEDTEHPDVRRLDVDFAACGMALVIIDSGASHADLTDEYAAIPVEMKKISGYFGKEYLRQVPKEDVLAVIPQLRHLAGDRAVLRALHFYSDNDRVPQQAQALEQGDVRRFLDLVIESGVSSWTMLQNITPAGYIEHQEMGIVLALCEQLLKGKGAWRVHGGGFAGTVQAFVPADELEHFTKTMDAMLGAPACHVLSIRPVGGTQITAQ